MMLHNRNDVDLEYLVHGDRHEFYWISTPNIINVNYVPSEGITIYDSPEQEALDYASCDIHGENYVEILKVSDDWITLAKVDDRVFLFTKEFCCQCGRSVRPGSGFWVNRIPAEDPSAPYPTGEWVCSACEEERERELENDDDYQLQQLELED